MAPKTPPGQTRGQIFSFVRERLLRGQPPTVREVQRAFGFRSVQTAREHLEGLVSEGKLGKEPGKARGYRLASELGSPPALVPLLGHVQAGALTEAVEDPDGYVAVQGHVASDELFALKVRGDSMMDAGILSGDMVIVRRQPSANSGEIVVAFVDGEATVKRLRTKKGRIELHPENARFDPIIPDGDKLIILGRVIEVRRYLEGTQREL
ncbi:MAG: repressor LexA [Proteobacteria bacterium]|nr:repressor LexA [Pseudomonadota bacterium]